MQHATIGSWLCYTCDFHIFKPTRSHNVRKITHYNLQMPDPKGCEMVDRWWRCPLQAHGPLATKHLCGYSTSFKNNPITYIYQIYSLLLPMQSGESTYIERRERQVAKVARRIPSAGVGLSCTTCGERVKFLMASLLLPRLGPRNRQCAK